MDFGSRLNRSEGCSVPDVSSISPEYIRILRANLEEIAKTKALFDSEILRMMRFIRDSKTDPATRSRLRADISKMQREKRELDRDEILRKGILKNYERDRK